MLGHRFEHAPQKPCPTWECPTHVRGGNQILMESNPQACKIIKAVHTNTNNSTTNNNDNSNNNNNS